MLVVTTFLCLEIRTVRQSTRALLLNTLVFPGTGHLVLQYRVIGYSLIAAATVATITIFYYVMNSALQVVESVTSGEVPPDFFVIRKLVIQQQAAADTSTLNFALLVLVVSWLVGIIDVLCRPHALSSDTGRQA